MRIAIVGGRGQLAAAVAHECAQAHDVAAFSRADLDVTDARAVDAAVASARPDAIVVGAAFTNVDAAEDRPVEAFEVNAFAVRTLARVARSIGALLVHFSTDFVFDGTASRPYLEDDRPNPRSVYAASKLVGEWFALDAPLAYVLRVESLFGRAPGAPPAKGSVAGIMSTLLAGGWAKAFEDRTISPTYVLDAARAVRFMVERRPAPGIYHCVNSGSCTWLEFGRELARQLDVEPRLTPVRMADMELRAERPMYCVLSNEKLRAIGVDMPPWQDALARFVQSSRVSS